MKKTLSDMIKEIVDINSGFEIMCSPCGFNANTTSVPDKKCKCCGAIIAYKKEVVGLGDTPEEAVANLWLELNKK